MKNPTKIILLLLSLILIQNCVKLNKKPLVIGHRGAMGHETENTLASVEKALDLEVDMIEIDVFKIKSGEIVVFHDVEVSRLSNSHGKIEDFEIDGLNKLQIMGGHTIPLLRDVLNVIDKKAMLNIELKGAGTSSEVNKTIEQYIEEFGWEMDDFIISSFKWDELRQFRKLNKAIPIAILTEEDPLEAIEIAKELNAEAINPNFTTLSQDIVDKIKLEGFKIYTWTVNDQKDIGMAKLWAVDGIITNFPERVE